MDQVNKSNNNGGGVNDVTSATEMKVAETPKTIWDVLSNRGPGRFSPRDGEK